MSVSIGTRLEKIQREFLWGGGSLEKKPHLVNWKTVCIEKKKGGLGLHRFSILNKALLCKWCWRSLVKALGVGVLAISKEVLGLGCGRKSEKNGPNLSKMLLFPLVMGVGSPFGRMFGVARRR